MSEDMDPGGGGGGSGSGTKKALQEMSKDELMQRCRALLALAQKAKMAKEGKSEKKSVKP